MDQVNTSGRVREYMLKSDLIKSIRMEQTGSNGPMTSRILTP